MCESLLPNSKNNLLCTSAGSMLCPYLKLLQVCTIHASAFLSVLPMESESFFITSEAISAAAYIFDAASGCFCIPPITPRNIHSTPLILVSAAPSNTEHFTVSHGLSATRYMATTQPNDAENMRSRVFIS